MFKIAKDGAITKFLFGTLAKDGAISKLLEHD